MCAGARNSVFQIVYVHLPVFLLFLSSIFFFLIMSLFKTLLDSSQGQFLLMSLHGLAGLK